MTDGDDVEFPDLHITEDRFAPEGETNEETYTGRDGDIQTILGFVKGMAVAQYREKVGQSPPKDRIEITELVLRPDELVFIATVTEQD